MNIMIDLMKYTTIEFANMIDEDFNIIRELMRDNDYLGYTDKPYYYTMIAVNKSTIKEVNKEIVTKYIYTNLFNRPEHRFYNDRGYSIELRGC